MNSVVTETYDGVANQGITGLFTGLGWGLVGTISKPAIGMLDLATGAATAVRESSRSSSRQLPKRMRPPRLVLGPGGSLPVYSARDGAGQEMMYRMNGRDYGEIFVAHEQLRSGEDDLQGGRFNRLWAFFELAVFSSFHIEGWAKEWSLGCENPTS